MDLHNNWHDFISRVDPDNNQHDVVAGLLITTPSNVKQMNQAKHLSHQDRGKQGAHSLMQESVWVAAQGSRWCWSTL